MPWNLLNECAFTGPAFPEPFVKFDLEGELKSRNLIPKTTGKDAKALEDSWNLLQRKLRKLVAQGGAARIFNHVLEPLKAPLGYESTEEAETVATREGDEEGGTLFKTKDGSGKLRVWATSIEADLDAPTKRGFAYRFGIVQIARRVLAANNERFGIITNGSEIRLIIADPARADSQVSISIDPAWKRAAQPPDAFLFLLAIASPKGIAALPEIIEEARLKQAKVTKDLRLQARSAVEGFIQSILDHPANQQRLATEFPDKQALAKQLWREGLITVYRLLFIFKLEGTDDPARSFSFASSSLWRNSFSPSVALAHHVRQVIDKNQQTGRLLEDGLRTLFRILSEGLDCTEMPVRPMGGALFAPNSTPLLNQFTWGETAVAKLLDHLLWTSPQGKGTTRERVHYGPLDVEDLGRVYEALLELDPGYTTEAMCRLRRNKLEVVVPVAQGTRYRLNKATETDDQQEEADEEENGKKSKVAWIEEIQPNRFFLRAGLGRKATGSFYTPHSFVRFLVRETLSPLVEKVSPISDPNPNGILALKVIDKAMGSAHFLVEACRFLGEKLYEAARQCDELASSLDEKAEKQTDLEKRQELQAKAATLRQRVIDIPDPSDEILKYLPSRAPEGSESGHSQNKAIALCKRLIAVHCIYGVDLNPLAVELAKLALWIECHAEGLPLTFLDHRLLVGNALTGPFFDQLLRYPGTQQPLDDLFSQNLSDTLSNALNQALKHVRELEETVGVTLAEVEAKQAAKQRLDQALAPFKLLAAAWSGGVMLGTAGCDDTAYGALAKHIAEKGSPPEDWQSAFGNNIALPLAKMIARGLGLPSVSQDDYEFDALASSITKHAIPALPFDLTFPEVFYPDGNATNRTGFDADLGNPPWDRPRFERKEVLGSLWLPILEAMRSTEWQPLANEFLGQNPKLDLLVKSIETEVSMLSDFLTKMFPHSSGRIEGASSPGDKDLYLYFIERGKDILADAGTLGFVTGGGFAKNTASSGVRQLLLAQRRLKVCLHFVNFERLFADLPDVVEFCVIVSNGPSTAQSFQVASELRQLEYQLFDSTESLPTRPFQGICGPHWNVLASTTKGSHELKEALGEFILSQLFSFTRELDKSQDDTGFVHINSLVPGMTDARGWGENLALLKKQALPLRGSRTFHVMSSMPTGLGGKRSPAITLAVPFSYPKAARFLRRAAYFRIGIRRHVGSVHTNERSLVPCLFAPGFLANDQLIIEGEPWQRPNFRSLLVLAVLSAFPTEAQIRHQIGAMMTMGVLAAGKSPLLSPKTIAFLVHSSLRCSCQHFGYAPLWREQLGNTWRESSSTYTWPVLPNEDARWAVRSAIDAVVAKDYGLDRKQYEHVLSTFSHNSYPKAPQLCLEKFDELERIGLDAFTKKYDPYWDIPLNEKLPEPVIDLPLPTATPPPAPSSENEAGFALQSYGNEGKRRRK